MSNPEAPQSRVWLGDAVLRDDADLASVAALLHQHDTASAWAMVDPGDAERIEQLGNRFGLDEWVRRDLSRTHSARSRPQVRYESLDQVQSVITAAVDLPDGGQLRDGISLRPVSLVISDRLLLVVAEQAERDALADRLVALQKHLVDGGIERATQAVLYQLSAGYFAVVEAVEAASDDLADSLFDLKPLSAAEKGLAFSLRRTVTQLRRVTEPMREVVEDLGQGSSDDPDTVSRSWGRLIEHQQSVSAAADDLRDSLNALFDTSLAFDDSRMNDVMKKLTGWAAIVAVPTLVTGFAGMNVPYWLDGTVTGFWVYLVIMVVGVIALYIVFRKRNWI